MVQLLFVRLQRVLPLHIVNYLELQELHRVIVLVVRVYLYYLIESHVLLVVFEPGVVFLLPAMMQLLLHLDQNLLQVDQDILIFDEKLCFIHLKLIEMYFPDFCGLGLLQLFVGLDLSQVELSSAGSDKLLGNELGLGHIVLIQHY